MVAVRLVSLKEASNAKEVLQQQRIPVLKFAVMASISESTIAMMETM